MKLFGKKEPKPSQEERILDTKVQLEKLKDRYEEMMVMQRRILKKNPTPHEKEMAEAKIRSGICAYTICSRASEDLDEITSDIELNQSLKQLNRSLKYVNKLARKSRRGVSRSGLEKRVKGLTKYEEGQQPDEIFGDDAQAAVDAWLGSKWESVAGKFIAGASLQSCLDESRITLESEPMPFMEGDVFGAGGMEQEADPENSLRDLLDSDIF